MSGSIPIELLTLKGHVALRWIDAADADYTLPFLRDTIDGQVHRGRVQRLTLADELAKLAQRGPTAFLFHMSRCGSTLTSRMLSAVSRFHVISEPISVNQVLRLDGIGDGRREVLLNGLINALAPRDQVRKQAYFVKLTSWNSLYLPIFRQLYPETPWIYIYREPAAVLASHARAPASWLASERLNRLSANLGMSIDFSATRMEQIASAIAAICEQACRHFNPGQSLFLNYDTLRTDSCQTIAEFLQIDISKKEQRAMRAVGAYHAKNIHQRWEGECVTAAGVSALVQMAADKLLMPIYEQLCHCETIGAPRSMAAMRAASAKQLRSDLWIR